MKRKNDNIRRGWLFAIIGCIVVDIIMYLLGDASVFGFFMFDFILGMLFFCIGAGVNLTDNSGEDANSLSSYYETDRATGEIIAELRKLNRDLGNGNGSSCDANSLSSYYETNRANGAIIAELQRLNNSSSSAGANSQSSYYKTNRANGAIIDNLKQIKTSAYRSKDDIANQIRISLDSRRD